MKENPLRILYLSQYYPPEIGATQTRAVEMAAHLTRMGHQVTVLTEFPNHPLGVIPAPYKWKLFQRSRETGIEVIRLWVFARPKKTFVTRMAFYISYMFTSLLAGLLLWKKYDVVYATSPPLFVAVSGYGISLLRRSRFVMEVRDLWPESAVALGELSNPRFIALAEKLEKFLYDRAVKVVVVTRGIADKLACKIPAEKIVLIPNGANTELYRPAAKDPALRKSLGLDESSFVVCYTGLMGLAHGLEFVLEAARIAATDRDICFLFIGDGIRKKYLVDTAQENRLENIKFLAAQPEEQLPAFISLSDAGLVTTKKIELCQGTLPVKMFTYMACAKPILLCVEGEARRLVENREVGPCLEPENAEQLVEAIRFLKNHPEQCAVMGANGRRFVEQHYSRRRQAEMLAEVLTRIGAP
jgi:colanic acid biosynthesis glycosyl transferase WcaI